jgi:Zn finger protein HypA/HybF involved in hydrogenase expression
MMKLGLMPMGGNHKLYKRRLAGFVFAKRPKSGIIGKSRPLTDYLVLNGPSIATAKLKKKLFKAGLKKETCEMCGQGPVWNNKPLTFHLDHEDGNNRNCRLENLRILCPNCHTQTPTYAVSRQRKEPREIRDGDIKPREPLKCKSCGHRLKKRRKTGLCRKCFEIKSPPPRKVSNRPEESVLAKEILEMGYCGVGRKYGVSDNAVRKWARRSMCL